MDWDAPRDAASAGARVRDAAAAVLSGSGSPPRVGVVLGSGLGAFGDTLSSLRKIRYVDIPGMPAPKVEGHAGNLCLGGVDGVEVACLQGRVHAYEGWSMESVVFGARLLAELGCRSVLLTNAAGAVNQSFAPGELMLVVDHLNLMGANPLVGPNEPGGPRFPDMTAAYDPALREAARRAALDVGVSLREGVYAAMLGPTYETPAEVRMVRCLGGDAVGMSTVPEVIALRHRGVRVGAMSCITNLAAGLSGQPLDHGEVEETARRARATFVAVLARWVVLTAEMVA